MGADIDRQLFTDDGRLTANWVEDEKLYLLRCYVCDPKNGRENWACAVAAGICAWCGWEPSDTLAKEHTTSNENNYGYTK